MSAYVVDKDVIDRLIAGAIDARIIAIASAKEWGQTLWRENVVSVAFRYNLATRDPDELASYNRDVAAYEYEPCAVTAQQIDADIDCLDYQSCEHDGWDASAAHGLLQRLREAFPSRPVVKPYMLIALDKCPATCRVKGIERLQEGKHFALATPRETSNAR